MKCENGQIIEDKANLRYWIMEQARYLKATREYSPTEKRLIEFNLQANLFRKEPEKATPIRRASYLTVLPDGQSIDSNNKQFVSVLLPGVYRYDKRLDFWTQIVSF
jgi:hypothetical protein